LERDHVVAAVTQCLYDFLYPVPSVLAPKRVDVGQTPETHTSLDQRSYAESSSHQTFKVAMLNSGNIRQQLTRV
jgi:hypothetical protein